MALRATDVVVAVFAAATAVHGAALSALGSWVPGLAMVLGGAVLGAAFTGARFVYGAEYMERCLYRYLVAPWVIAAQVALVLYAALIGAAVIGGVYGALYTGYTAAVAAPLIYASVKLLRGCAEGVRR